jgi:membrane protein CcdC involved in cytochrome C biogenesis
MEQSTIPHNTVKDEIEGSMKFVERSKAFCNELIVKICFKLKVVNSITKDMENKP